MIRPTLAIRVWSRSSCKLDQFYDDDYDDNDDNEDGDGDSDRQQKKHSQARCSSRTVLSQLYVCYYYIICFYFFKRYLVPLLHWTVLTTLFLVSEAHCKYLTSHLSSYLKNIGVLYTKKDIKILSNFTSYKRAHGNWILCHLSPNLSE